MPEDLDALLAEIERMQPFPPSAQRILILLDHATGHLITRIIDHVTEEDVAAEVASGRLSLIQSIENSAA